MSFRNIMLKVKCLSTVVTSVQPWLLLKVKCLSTFVINVLPWPLFDPLSL